MNYKKQKQGFLKALKENEDDETIRLVYSDFLEENGEYEEADRMRKWQEAKKWLVEICEKNNNYYKKWDYDEDDSYVMRSYEWLIEKGREAIIDYKTNHNRKIPPGEINYYETLSFSCGAAEELHDILNDNKKEFWKKFSIVIGINIPENVKYGYFSCGC